MKFLHLADLHIGKRLNGVSLIDDQKYIFNQINGILKQNSVDAVVIAGDIYDKQAPSAEATELFDDFLTSLSKFNIPIMIISGNHDSPERLSFAGRILENNNIYIYSIFDGSLKCITVKDVDFYLLPFVRPQTVRRFFPDENFNTCDEMMKFIFHDFKKSKKSVLVTHQFAVNGQADEQEVGTVINTDISIFKQFDYIALGHLHEPHRVSDNAVYAGSPLKYSLAEADYEKCVLIIDTDNDMSIEKIPLVPLRDMRKIKGELNNLISPDVYETVNTDDFVYVTLTDSDEITDAIGKLRKIYPNVMEIEFQNNHQKSDYSDITVSDIESKTPFELFCDFFQKQNGYAMTQTQESIIKKLIEEKE